jgi:hypothetical protein
MVLQKKEIRKLSVKQSSKQLAVEILPDKAMFDFYPNGGKIIITIKNDKKTTNFSNCNSF